MSFTAAALALALVAHADDAPEGFNHPEFACSTDESGRFLALERDGNGPDRTGKIDGPKRNAYVTVLEYLGQGKPLRKLYEVELLSPAVAERMLSTDGRFLVTLDDMQTSGISPFTVVIYDLARKEHTAYAGKDFLGEEAIRALPDDGFRSGFKWHGTDDVFDRFNTKFYPTLPSNCKEERVPFVVIDLPTRTVRVCPLPQADPSDVVHPVDQKWGWLESREVVPVHGTVLPRRVMRSKSRGVLDELFELSPDKSEYFPVPKAPSSAN